MFYVRKLFYTWAKYVLKARRCFRALRSALFCPHMSSFKDKSLDKCCCNRLSQFFKSKLYFFWWNRRFLFIVKLISLSLRGPAHLCTDIVCKAISSCYVKERLLFKDFFLYFGIVCQQRKRNEEKVPSV